MADDIKELRKIVSFAIENNLNLDVQSVKVTPLTEDNGIETLRVEISISLSKKRLPRDIMYDLVKSAASAIRNSGESRYPVILPHLAEKQLLAARS